MSPVIYNNFYNLVMEEKDQEAEGLLNEERNQSDPSDKWSDYSNSSLSQKYVEKD